MKRRFTGSDGNDSLELLLDTLCNVFGGIVLIACLLAIVPRATMPPPLLPVKIATAQMTERRIASARVELQRLESEIERMSQSADHSCAALQARRNSLRKVLGEMKKSSMEVEDLEMMEANARAIIAQADPKAMRFKHDQLKLQIVESENLSKASKEKCRFLEERIKRLEEEAATLINGKVQAVRFPRERIKNSAPFPIIAHYGQLYPMAIGANLNDNDAIIKVPMLANDAVRAEPVRGKGLAMPESRAILMTTLKAVAGRGAYVSIYLALQQNLWVNCGSGRSPSV